MAEDEVDPYGVALGARLRAVRKQKHLSLQEVEQGSGREFKASVLGAYERGQRRIAVPRLQRLAQIYKVPVDQLLPAGGEAGGDEEADRPAGRRAEQRAVIDVARLDTVAGPERDLLRRYLESIEVQRQDFNGRVLTIRREDLRVIASMLQLSVDTLLGRLDELGLLVGYP
ncbi:MAG: transcriptional regulator [Acidimicrobiales bacterium]